MVSNEQVFDRLRQVMHPEFEHDLVELGMIKDVVVQDGHVTLTLNLPFKEVPVKDQLVHRVDEVLTKLDANLKVQVKLAEMSQQELERAVVARAELAAECSGLAAERDDLAARLATAEAGLEAARARLAEILASRSWRWTAPVRGLIGGLSTARSPDHGTDE